jgi:hypothetical protein
VANEFIHLMASISRSADILTIFGAISNILNNFTESNTSFLPGSVKQAP